MKIAVYAMARNEVSHVARFAECTQEADLVIVTDTGSDDGTPEALQDHGIEVRHSRIVPWRFDHGSNAALHHVPEDVDVCVKLDLDEVITTNDGSSWRAEIERIWVPGETTQIRYWYTWSWLKEGEIPGVKFMTANIHARSGYHWRHPGHSALTYQGTPKIVNTEVLEIHHYMTSKQRPDYLHLLQLGVHECPCPRTLYYLGREYFYRGQFAEAIKTLNQYLDHPEAHWPSERANSMRLIGLSYDELNQPNLALEWLIRSTTTFPNERGVWYYLLRHFYRHNDFSGGYWAGLRCLTLTKRNPDWVGKTEEAWTEYPYVMTAQCAATLGRNDLAEKFLKTALEMNPDSIPGNKLKLELNL